MKDIRMQSGHLSLAGLVSRWMAALLGLWVILSLSGCIFSSESQQVRAVTESFWKAVLQEDMDKAKDLSTWESSQYLHFLSSKSISAQRFEVGEIRIQDNMAEAATVLYGGEKGDMQIPLRTVLIRNNDRWQVDVQKTMGSMVSGAMGAVVDQLNDFMHEGLDNLDKSLSDSMDKLGESLQKGVDQLKKDLSKPPSTPAQPAPNPGGQAI